MARLSFRGTTGPRLGTSGINLRLSRQWRLRRGSAATTNDPKSSLMGVVAEEIAGVADLVGEVAEEIAGVAVAAAASPVAGSGGGWKLRWRC